MPTRIGIDTGGTFTDVAVLTGDGLRVHKLPSTPDDPARAVLDGLAAVRGRGSVDVVHGSTVGLNAILTGQLARTALVTNQGFEDLIEIGRQARADVYDLTAQRPQLPVPRRLRFGVGSRRGADGKRLARPSAAELDALRERLRRSGAEAIAIGLLHSYAHPEDERALSRALRPLGLPITCSADLLATAGEYERFAAAILNAAITPVMGAYLGRLQASIDDGRLRLMRSSGGIMAAEEAARFPARAVFSGPAGGVLATRQCARAFGFETVAGFDMGGTSTDVCLVSGTPQAHDGGTVAGLPLAVPAVEVQTIGCGGGSIARRDRGGALRVGPESAGAMPGPVCYGHGDQPTVTDAHMVLGHMGAETLLGGGFPVDPELSVHAVQRLGDALGLDLRATAEGILEIAEIAMLRALMVITVERALDPAKVPLVAFGGAGGLHAASLARRLGMPCALVPPHPGAWSAVGLALAGAAHDVLVPVLTPFEDVGAKRLQDLARDAMQRARAALDEPGRARSHVDVRMRFAGQGDGLYLPHGSNLDARFRALHQERFGFVPEHGRLELVELRARAERPERPLPVGAASKARRRVPKPSAVRRAPRGVGGNAWPVHQRDDLRAGDALAGPCLVEEHTGVTVIPARVQCSVSQAGLMLTQA